jgi:hypothetical protein
VGTNNNNNNCNTTNNYVSQLDMIYGKLQQHPALASEFQIKFADLMSEFGQKLREPKKAKNDDRNVEYVSLFPKTDTAARCVRVKSGYETPCKRKIGKDGCQKSKR